MASLTVFVAFAPIILFLIIGSIIVYLIAKRIHDKDNETFEKRDN